MLNFANSSLVCSVSQCFSSFAVGNGGGIVAGAVVLSSIVRCNKIKRERKDGEKKKTRKSLGSL